MEDWTEKYRPKSLDDIVGNEKAVSDLRKWAKSWDKDIPKKRALILAGKAGVGKTSCAYALAKDYGWQVIELNTSDARNACKIKAVATYGALNETFDDSGNFSLSKDGGRKIIILDEADNLYEKIQGSKNIDNDLSDKGGKKAIIETIKITKQPIVLIVNDYYNLIRGSGETLKSICNLIKFYNPYSNAIANLLKKICIAENITVEKKVLQTIADRSKGDIRSAVNDLQSISMDKKQIYAQSLEVLGYRDREKIIFDALREIFKTKNIQSIKNNLTNLDEDPQSVILWIDENLPHEYKDFDDLSKGYLALSKADIFLGRTQKIQNYRLWSYAIDIMNWGVAIAKTHDYPNERYNFPLWLKALRDSKSPRDIRDSIIKKINQTCHNSKNKSQDFVLSFFTQMFRNNIEFAIKMKNRFDLSESEIKFLLGKDHLDKLNMIVAPTQIIKTTHINNDEKLLKIKDKKENIQQNLFDF